MCKLPNASTAIFTWDTGMVDFTENPNACPLEAIIGYHKADIVDTVPGA